MQQLLDRQADIIEMVLASHQIEGRVWGGTVTPRYVRYDLTATAGTRVRKVLALQDEIAMALGVSAIRLYRKGGAIRVEVPRVRWGMVGLLALNRVIKRLPDLTAILGVDEDGVPLLMRLPSPDVAHVLVAGTTGSGKTVLLRSMILSLAMHNSPGKLSLVLFDPKGRGFGPLSELPHLIRPIVSEPTLAIRLLDGLVKEMERRDREKINTPALCIVIDELADLRMSGGKAVEEALTRLTQRGREAGIHTIVATQRPATTVVGGLVKANLPVRLVGAVGSPEDAKVATGIAGSGAEQLGGRGDFLLVARAKTLRMQAAYVSDPDIRRIVRQLNSRSAVEGSSASRSTADSLPAFST